MSETPFPSNPGELTPSWLTGALRQFGTLGPEESVTGVRSVPVTLQGAASTVVRLGLDYAPAGAGPASLVAKLAPADAGVRAAINASGAPYKEVRFYRQVIDSALPAVPACYAAEYDRESGTFLLLLEDLSHWRTGDVFRPVPGDVSILLRAIAGLHARFWGDVALAEARWITQPTARWTQAMAGAVARSLPRCREMFSDHIGPNIEAVAELAGNDPRVFELLGQGPLTLLHGDLWVQNAMFRDGEACVIDWSSCLRGMGMVDIAELLLSSLETGDRRRLTGEMVGSYCAILARAGVPSYPVATAMEDLAVALAYSVVMYLASMPTIDLSAMRAQELESGVSMLDATFGRLEAALADHRTLDALRRRISEMPEVEHER